MVNSMRANMASVASTHVDNAVGEVLSRIVKNLEAGKISIAVFLDLSKAFDTLNHDLLLHKMERYGIRGVTLEWFKSYLHDRKDTCEMQTYFLWTSNDK